MKKFVKRIISLFLAALILFNGQIVFAFSDTEFDKKAFNSFFEEELEGIENPDEETTEVPEDIEIGEEEPTDITEEDNPDLEEFIRIPFENFDINLGTSAPSLLNGQTISKTLETGETHTYKITVPYKAECSVTLSSSEYMYIYLRDKDDKQIPYQYAGGTGIKKISRLFEPETYYIRIEGNKGDYSLKFTIDTTEDKHSNKAEGATELINKEATSGIIDYPGDSDYFVFTVPYKAECTILLSSSVYMYQYLKDENDKQIPYQYAGGTGIKKISRLFEPGTYYILIEGNKGGYELTFNVDTTEDKHGNKAENATELINKETSFGIIDYPGDSDYFVFTVPYKAECTILLSSSAYMYQYLKDENDKQIPYQYAGGTGVKKISRLFEPGTYYITIDGSKGDYELTFNIDTTEDEHSNKAESATELINKETSFGIIDYPGDSDYFVFTVPYKAECTIILSSSAYMYQYLKDENDKQIPYQYAGGTGTKKISRLFEPGTYYVLIEGNKGDYELTFTVDTTEDKHSNTAEGATKLTESKTSFGIIDYHGDSDYFVFTVPYKAECTIILASSAYMYQYLKDENDKQIPYQYAGGTGTKKISRLFEPGTYYILIEGSKGDYELTFTVDTTEDKHNNNAKDATKLTGGKASFGIIDYPGDSDYFVFTVPYKAECTIMLSSSVYMYQYLKDENDKQIPYQYAGGTGVKKISRLLEAGTYYILIEGSKGDYELTFTVDTTEDKHSNTAEGATKLTESKTSFGIIDYPGDSDYFVFNVPYKAECTIILSSSAYMYQYLKDVNNKQIPYQYAGGTGVKKISRLLEPGTYYILIEGNKGDYELTFTLSSAGTYANKIKPPPEVNITRDDVAADVAKGLYTWEDFNYLVALRDEATDYEGFYAVACCVRNRVRSSAFTQNSYKAVASIRTQFTGFKEKYIGSFEHQYATNAAVAVLRGGVSIVGDSCSFFGIYSKSGVTYDIWFESSKVGNNKPIVIGTGFYRNVYHNGYVHNAESTKTSDTVILFNATTRKWYDQ